MNTRRWVKPVAMLAVGTLALGACGSDDAEGGGSIEDGDLSGTIVVSGSSTVEPVSIKVAEAFAEIAPDVEVSVSGPGTGDGFALFCEGESDVSDASRPIKDEEAEICADNGIEYVELKVAFDGMAVMTNNDNSAASCLNFNDLYAMVGPEAQGITNWSDAEPVASELGSTTEFPDLELKVVAPGAESGTYDSFIEIVLEGVAETRFEEGHIEEDAIATTRSDYNSSADDNAIIQGIESDEGSLGWVGFAFAEENIDDLQVLPVDGGDGCVEPTVETIADGSYPVSRGLYIYVNKEKAESNEALKEYINLYLGDAYVDSVTRAFGESGYVVLPEDQLNESKAAWEAVG